MSVEGFSDKECGCGCGNLLRRTTADAGWKYIYGHKPKLVRTGLPVGDAARHKPRPGVVREVGFSATLAMVEENRAAMLARKLEIDDEISTMQDELAQMDVVKAALAKDLAELDLLRDALAPFCGPWVGVGRLPRMAEVDTQAITMTDLGAHCSIERRTS